MTEPETHASDDRPTAPSSADESLPAYVARIDSPRAMVEAVPHLLGFVPESSVVLSFMAERPDGAWRSFGSARVDLPAPADVSAWIDGVLAPVLQRVQPGALIITYWLAAEGGERPRSAMAHRGSLDQAMRRHIARSGIRLLDVIAIAGERYASLLCEDLACCGERGEEWSAVESSAVSARLVTDGVRMPVGSRRVLEAECAPDVDAMRAFDDACLGLASESGDAQNVREVACAVLDRWFESTFLAAESSHGGGQASTATDQAVVAVALLQGDARDACVWMLLGATADQLNAAQTHWRALARAASPRLRVMPAAMAGLTAYLLGDGARANIAIETAMAAHAEVGEAGVGGARRQEPPTLVRIFDELFTAGLTPGHIRDLLTAAYSDAATTASVG